MVERYPGWWNFYVVARALYLRFGIITFLFMGMLGILVFNSDRHISATDYTYTFGSWILLITPFIVNYLVAKKRKQMIQIALKEIKETGYFCPDKNSEMWLFWQGTYLGLDYRNGTIVYIRVYPGKVMDVIGFDADSLVGTDVEGRRLRLHTRFASLPVIPIESLAATNIADHLHGMNNKGYHYSFNFPALVNSKRKRLSEIAGIPIPELV